MPKKKIVTNLPEVFITKEVADSVAAERILQDGKYGGPFHDDTHKASFWVQQIRDRAIFAQRNFNTNPKEYRRRMVQVTALAITALESHDRAFPNE